MVKSFRSSFDDLCCLSWLRGFTWASSGMGPTTELSQYTVTLSPRTRVAAASLAFVKSVITNPFFFAKISGANLP